MNCKKIKMISVFLLAIILLTTFNFVSGNKLSVVSVNNIEVNVGPKVTNTKEPTSNIQVSSGSVNVKAGTNNSEDLFNIISSTESSGNIQASSQQIKEYKEALNVSGIVVGKVKVVAKLIERKIENKDNFKEITKVSRIVEETEDREILAEELLYMDQNFVNKFSNDLEVKPKLKDQVENYVNLVKLKRKVRVEIQRNSIEDLFNKKITIDDFANQLWNEV